MSSEVLVEGLKFAVKHNLTQKEIGVLFPLLSKPYTVKELAEVEGINGKTLHHVIQRLKLKGLISLKNRDSKGTNCYEFKLEV